METTIEYCYSACNQLGGDVSKLSASAPQSRGGIISFYGNSDTASDAGKREKGEWVEEGEAGAVRDCSAGCVGGWRRCNTVSDVVQRHKSVLFLLP